jgi:hypothetical protein
MDQPTPADQSYLSRNRYPKRRITGYLKQTSETPSPKYESPILPQNTRTEAFL